MMNTAITNLHNFEAVEFQKVINAVENLVWLGFPPQQPEQFHWNTAPSLSSVVAAKYEYEYSLIFI